MPFALITNWYISSSRFRIRSFTFLFFFTPITTLAVCSSGFCRSRERWWRARVLRRRRCRTARHGLKKLDVLCFLMNECLSVCLSHLQLHKSYWSRNRPLLSMQVLPALDKRLSGIHSRFYILRFSFCIWICFSCQCGLRWAGKMRNKFEDTPCCSLLTRFNFAINFNSNYKLAFSLEIN